MQSFDQATIDSEYHRLGYHYGWTFLGTPERTLHEAQVGFVGLNPGGGGPNDTYRYQGIWAGPGNGYFNEKWGPNGTESAIQRQVQKWHELIGLKPNESLCAQFVPFRSPNWNSLDRKAEAIAFAEKLWGWVFSISPATLFVTMGKRPAECLARILHGRHVARMPAGWGRQVIDVWDTPSKRRIIGMPHPSRYTLFNRSNGASDLAEASFRAAVGHGHTS